MFRKYFKILSDENFDRHSDKINRENKFGLELILLFDSLILCMNLIGHLVAGHNLLHIPMLLAQAIIIGIAVTFYLTVLRRRNVHYTLWIYLIETPVLIATMLTGTLHRPAEISFTFLVFLLLFPLLILDKPWRIDLYIIAFGIAFAIIDHETKISIVFRRDAIHLINIIMMSVAANIYFLIFRIRNIEYAAYFAKIADEDPLTGLYNRAGARHHINASDPGIFIYIDLDRFKGVNDQFGHEAGDEVIRETADVLRSSFRREDILIRLGGDEFAVYASGTWSYDHVRDKLSELLDRIHAMKLRHSSHNSTETMTASIGCAYAPNGCNSLEDLIRIADEAMYRAKKGGKDEFCIRKVGR